MNRRLTQLVWLAFALFALACGTNNGISGTTDTGPKSDSPNGSDSTSGPDASVFFDVKTSGDSNTSGPDVHFGTPDQQTPKDVKQGTPDQQSPVDTHGADVKPKPDVTVTPDTTSKDAASADTATSSDVSQPSGIPSLGNGTHNTNNVTIEVIATADKSKLSTPRDLAFNPEYPNELWIVNYTTESMSVVSNVDNPDSPHWYFQTDSGHHFLARPASLAFGTIGRLATVHETDQLTQGPNGTPGDFMGPTLYTSDINVFDGGHGGHYDMLHNSPLGMGIAWESANIYWIFDGYHSSLTRYDFNQDHGAGGSDHTDGVVRRYVENQVKRYPLVPSHMYLAPQSNLLYVADTGNNRIAVLDITTGTLGGSISPNYDGSDQRYMNNAKLTTLITGTDFSMQRPSGLEIHNNVLYITDNVLSAIFAFTLQGKLIDYLQIHQTIPSGSMMGIALDGTNRIYVVDSKGNRVLRISPKP